MNNGKQAPAHKPVIMAMCDFCSFVRGHERETPHATRMGSERERSLHNNIYNNNIYISELAGCCVSARGIA